MVLLVILAAVVALCTSGDVSTISSENSHYVNSKGLEAVPHFQDFRKLPDGNLQDTHDGSHNQYWLYTRLNPHNHQILKHGEASTVQNSNYNGNLPLQVIVHGWRSKGSSSLNPLITSAFLAVQDCNVIVVDWSRLARHPYFIAVKGVPSVGQFLGNFLMWLLETAGGNWNQIHLVGHSLGAHVNGNAGRTIGSRPARISGLDPAGPQWHKNPNALNSNDAQYVEVIHTDGGNYGILDPIGLTNFYPNGGKGRQPGCSTHVCSHSRATQLFASSVRTNHFTGRLCTGLNQAKENNCSGSILKMGNAIINKTGAGLYGLSTGGSWPF